MALKVIYILNATDIYGGATKAFISLMEGLRRKGVAPMVVVPNTEGIYNYLKENDIPVVQLNYRHSVYPPAISLKDKLLFLPRLLGRIYLNHSASRKVQALAKSFNADLIHTNTSVNDIGFRAAQKLHIPHIWHIREYAARDFNYHYYPSRNVFLRKLKRRGSYSICITKDIQCYDNLAGWQGSRVIYDGVLSEKNIRQDKDKDTYLLFAGRLEENKGISDLLRAYAKYLTEVGSGALPLYVAGDTTDMQYKQALRELTRTLGVEEKIHFLGMRSDILELMSKARAVVVPSRSEGFGFISVESMFSGALVIGRNESGLKEQFDNGKELQGEEIALRYSTEKELVARLVEVTEKDINEYMPMIIRGQQTVRQLYSTEKSIDNIYNFYEDILK